MTRSLRHLRPALITPRGLLYETDCFNLFAALQDETIDCVFADPPFNLGKDYGNGRARDALGGQEYLKWTAAWLDECIRLMKPGAAMFVYILPQWGYRLASHLEDRGLEFRHWIALSMKAGFLRGLKLYPAHYAILYFTKGRPKTFNRVRLPIPTCRHCNRSIKDYGGHRKHLNPSGLNLTDFWEDTAPARHQRFKARSHINELKLMIPMRCLQIATQPDDVVLDPFAGGGSTLEAAEQHGRYWLGTELVSTAPIRARFARQFPGLANGRPSVLCSLFREPTAAYAISVK